MRLMKHVIGGVKSRLRPKPQVRIVPRVDGDLLERYVVKSLAPDAVFVEIGAATGASAVPFARRCKLDPSRCYLIEACPDNFEIMKQEAPGFRLVNLAIAAKTGTVAFFVVDDPQEQGSSRSNAMSLDALREKFPPERIKRIEVPAMSLDGFLKDQGLTRVDYVHMNCEGAEYEIFAGDLGFLEKIQMMSLDLHGRCATFNARKEDKLRIYDLMESAGFVRVGGHERQDILTADGHLSFLWERNAP